MVGIYGRDRCTFVSVDALDHNGHDHKLYIKLSHTCFGWVFPPKWPNHWTKSSSLPEGHYGFDGWYISMKALEHANNKVNTSPLFETNCIRSTICHLKNRDFYNTKDFAFTISSLTYTILTLKFGIYSCSESILVHY